MSLQRKITKRAHRRKLRNRRAIKQRSTLPRVSIFRSLNHIYAQIIDDTAQKTVASSSSLELSKLSGDKKAIARSVGLALAEKAKDKNITAVVFDRGSFLYHGRVKSLAEGLREGGLTF